MWLEPQCRRRLFLGRSLRAGEKESHVTGKSLVSNSQVVCLNLCYQRESILKDCGVSNDSREWEAHHCSTSDGAA